MIRKHKPQDLEQIIHVWENASAKAHSFLNSNFVEKVKSDMTNIYIPNSQTWIYEEKDVVIGFISMVENEIGGLFVLPDYHAQGIGTALVDFVQKTYSELEVEVFENNLIGRAFYNKYGFKKISSYFHEESGQTVFRLRLIR